MSKTEFWEKQINNYTKGKLDINDLILSLQETPILDIGFAKLDPGRELLQVIPEVIYCKDKTSEQITKIFLKLAGHKDQILGTKASEEAARSVLESLENTSYDPVSKLVKYSTKKSNLEPKNDKPILVIAAGTSDIPIAEESAQTVEFFGYPVIREYDLGISNLKRILNIQSELVNASVIICVAGMEGALPSVVAGLVSCPVIAVPTSVGYGSNFDGLATLLTMLNSQNLLFMGLN